MASVPAAGGSTIQANIQPGVGVAWRVCHTFAAKSSVNCCRPRPDRKKIHATLARVWGEDVSEPVEQPPQARAA